MKLSHYFLKTAKTVSEDDTSISARLLKQGGFVRESVAGRYYFLPVGQRVQQKIMAIIKEEMDAAGAQEMLAPILHPLELWQETNRTNTTGFELMKVKDRRGGEFALGGTAEEMFVDLIRKFTISYRDLPFHLYQFSPKFRDELRARGGLLRVREFIMKDGYSFHADEEDFRREYEHMKGVYSRIFDRLGLQTTIVEADNGYIGGEYCHEFIVESDAGESRYFTTPDGSIAAHEDVARFRRNPANAGADMLPLQTIDQPAWVQTMEDNEKHYGKPTSHYLKNVVYRNMVTGQIVIATLTGDLQVNQTKLEQALKAVGQLEAATEEDLAKLGTKTGYVHSWGHAGAYCVGDIVLEQARNLIGGQKEEATDTINVNYGRDFTCDLIADIALAYEGAIAENGQQYAEKKGIEVGNVFQLGLHYSGKMKGAVYVDAEGKDQPFYMGCYGIGIGRTMAAVVEKHYDAKGIMWPESTAPFHVHLIALEGGFDDAEKLYRDMIADRIEVLYDDREKTAGEKFADADLIGIPVRMVVSKKTVEKGSVEIKKRGEPEAKLVPFSEAIAVIEGE
ncbi:MAG: proline--tRNA ligase [Candidatus Sungbacteria bacterium]|nr:proline--tRNA ligase [Candidatus Sungbacteria bacterium]